MRHRRTLAAAGALGLAATLLAAPPVQAQQGPATLTQVATGEAPTAGAAGPDGTLWIAERAGTVRILDDQGLSQPVLDISSETDTEGERGLLGITFDDGYEHVYISYTGPNGNSQVDEIAVSNNQPDLGTRRNVLTVEQPAEGHNSGDITFGPDGMFYMTLGDGEYTEEGDPHDNGQNPNTVLGSLIRIDITESGYTVPADNPFGNEVWQYGLRNPWRFSFDAQTGDLWIGDVGHLEREEVNYLPAGTSGANFGWSIMEGTLQRGTEPEPSNHEPPTLEYPTEHGERCSVTGGYVYRGSAIPELQGEYVFSDWCEGDIRALDVQNGQVIEETNLGINAGAAVAFVEDHDNELYVMDIDGGGIYRIDPADGPPPTTTPPTTTPPPTTDPPTTQPPGGDCAVSYEANDWGGSSGFTANVSITNTGGSTIDGWELSWEFPAGQTVDNGWNASISQSGSQVTATDAGWNGTIAPSQTASFGFNGDASSAGDNPPPTAFTLNGTSCTVS